MTSSSASFIRSSTQLVPAPFVPEVRLHCADEAYGLWERIEQRACRSDLDPPFWAFVWPGGQGLARFVLDNPERVAGCAVGFLLRAAAGGARVLVGDPGRTYLPRDRFRRIADYAVPTVPDLEDAETKNTAVWELLADR
jgi:predicted nicotinamide N-methyase